MDTAPDKIALPFADSGGRRDIPIDSQILVTPGAASYTDGFPPLTRTPIAEGGVPPFGIDMNGILYALSSGVRWLNAGGGYPYDATFATAPEVAGYPAGARVMQSDVSGYWLNTVDGNDVNPESITAGEAATAGWRPEFGNAALVTIADATTTLTPAQYGKEVLILSGTLTANRSVYLPDISGKWAIVNNCVGGYKINIRTQSGSDIVGLMPGQAIQIVTDGSEARPAETVGIQSASNTVVSATGALDISSLSGTVYSGASTDITITLPSVINVRPGARVEFINPTSYVMTIDAFGAQSIINARGQSAGFIEVPAYGNLILESPDSSNWRAVGGSAAGQTFGSLAGSGYYEFPGGLIVQWGSVIQAGQSTVTYSFPTPFKSSVKSFSANKGATISTTAEPAVGIGSLLDVTTFEITNSSPTTIDQLIFWIAIGN